MRPEQRREVISRFDRATVGSKLPRLGRNQEEAAVSTEHCLSISAAESGINKLTLKTLQHMWDKAEKLLSTSNAITPAPGEDPTAKMVLSASKCLNWASSGICSHSLAVAEMNKSLSEFLVWFRNSGMQPNITTVAMTGLPGVPRRTRSRTMGTTPEISVPRPVFMHSADTRQHLNSPIWITTLYLQI